MKILFVGSTASSLSANIAWKLNEYQNISVDAIFSLNDKNDDAYAHKYENIYYYKFSVMSKIPKINGLLNTIRLLTKLLTIKKYDVIHIQSINPSLLYLMPFFKYKSIKVVSTVWGSDFERSQNIYFFKLILKYSDLITCTNDNVNKRLRVALNVPDVKILTLAFMLPIYHELDSLKEVSKYQTKMDINFPPNKIILGCGTNMRKMQHHLEIIDEIAKVKSDFSKSIMVLIQMTYDFNDEGYLTEIKNKLNFLEIEFIILSKYLSDVEMAMVRKSTDILIQVQDHDQFSAAMLETIYAENLVITGSWLPYSVLDVEGIFYFKVDKVLELGKIVLECINNFEQLLKKTKNNPKILNKLTNHDNIIEEWADTYKNLLLTK